MALFEAPAIVPHSWSPDGRYLAFWALPTGTDLTKYPLPPGDLWFLEAIGGRVCSSPYASEYPFNVGEGLSALPFGWLPDSRGLVLDPEGPHLLEPCAQEGESLAGLFPAPPSGVASVSPQGDHHLLVSAEGLFLFNPDEASVRPIDLPVPAAYPGYGWSPDGRWLAMYAITAIPADFEVAATLIDVQTAAIVRTFDTEFRSALGNLPAPTWLGETQFLLAETLHQGPLILSPQGEPRNVVLELFKLENWIPEATDRGLRHLTRAIGALAGDGSYHLVLVRIEGGGAEPLPLLLYHSEDGSVETLPASDFPQFSPDGRYVVWAERSEGDVVDLWRRTVDPIGSKPEMILRDWDSNLFMPWWEDSPFSVLAREERLVIFAPDGAVLQTLVTEGYQLQPWLWTEASRTLVLLGHANHGGQGLFVTHIP